MNDKYAIFQRVYNNRNKPRFFVLRPEPNASPPRFVMTSIPYADNIVGQMPKCKIPVMSNDKIDDEDLLNFCKSIDVYCDTCTNEVKLAPSMMIDFHSNAIVTEMAKQLLNQDFEFEEECDLLGCDFTEVNDYEEILKRNWPSSDDKITL